MRNILLLFALASISLSACVTKKKFVSALNDKAQMEAFYLDSITDIQGVLSTCIDTTTSLRLKLAERNGENNILEKLRHELQDQIDELELELELKSNKSVSYQKMNTQELNNKANEISSLKAQLKAVETTIQKYQNRVLSFIGDINMEFQGYDEKLLTITSRGNKGVLVLSANELIFKRKTSTSLSSQGITVIQKVSNIIKRYPDLEVFVIGHTDNKMPPKAYKDNWYFSTLRAVTLVREMTQNNDVNNNQVSPVGKAEYAPADSNESLEGRAKNNRIEIIVQPLSKNLIRDILKEVKE